MGEHQEVSGLTAGKLTSIACVTVLLLGAVVLSVVLMGSCTYCAEWVIGVCLVVLLGVALLICCGVVAVKDKGAEETERQTTQALHSARIAEAEVPMKALPRKSLPKTDSTATVGAKGRGVRPSRQTSCLSADTSPPAARERTPHGPPRTFSDDTSYAAWAAHQHGARVSPSVSHASYASYPSQNYINTQDVYYTPR